MAPAMASHDDGVVVPDSSGADMSGEAKRPVRVMFLAWGYSIHAQRRISIFCEDHRFEVCVVSTHNYGFQNARNVDLTAALRAGKAEPLDGDGDRKKDGVSGFGPVSLRKRFFSLLPVRFLLDTVTALKDLMILLRAAKQFRPDIIFLQTLMYPCYLSYFLPRTLPMLVTFWNGDVTWWMKSNGIERILKKQIVAWGVRRVSAITVNSQAAFDACQAHGVSAKKIHLIRYPGVDMGVFFPADKGAARQKIGISAGHVVFAPRGLGGFLNSEIIVKAAALVIREVPDTLFLLSSAVAEEGELEKHVGLASALGIADNCRWIPKIEWEKMPDYYNAADLMVSVSSNDSLPNCMLEAMACGVPLIMGDIPQIGEWISDGNNGFLVPVRDAGMLSDRILKVLENYGDFTAGFVSENLALVGREMDSRKNTEMIKDVVMQIAGTC